MKVLLLCRYSRLGSSSRVRFMQYLPALQALGVEVTVYPLLREDYIRRLYSGLPTAWGEVAIDYFRQLIRLFQARKFDCLWIEKEIFPNLPAWAEQLLVRMGVPYVVDYDDATFHNYDVSKSPLKRYLASKIDTVMANAALVVCGNEYLANRARKAAASHVEVVPTVIDLQRYTVIGRPQCNRIVVGWIGAPSTVKYLELVAPVLAALAKEFPLQLRVVGATFSWPGLDVVLVPWTESTEVASIQQFDIGIMPLLDSPWERGKCGYKLIQYMACGLPVAGSAVGVNREIIQHGVNGYLAASAVEWENALRVLIQDGELRGKMGAAGRAVVESKYCLQVTAPRIAELLRAVAGGGR